MNIAATESASTYLYRFEGRARAPHMGTSGQPSRPYFLVGQGVMAMRSDGTLGGEQVSSIMPTEGNDPGFRHRSVRLKGTFRFYGELTGAADIFFYLVDPEGGADPKPSLRGHFHLLGNRGPNLPEKFWFVSSKTLHLAYSNGLQTEIAVDELVRGEAIRT